MSVYYTIYPIQFAQENPCQMLLCTYQGVKMYVRHISGRDYQIQQILSTEPKDFLNRNIAPGKIIKM